MTHEWHKGMLDSSSWHGLETIGQMPDADAMINAAEKLCAWPQTVTRMGLQTVTNLPVPDAHAVVGSYWDGTRKALGVVGNRYRATTPQEWQTLIRAAVDAGAKPTGAFSLYGGTRPVATFDCGGNGIRNLMVLADSFDGTTKLISGRTSVRVVCANTMAMSMDQDGQGMAKLRHTAALEERVNVLAEAIRTSVESGQQVRDLYAKAQRATLSQETASAIFDALFPKAPEDSSKTAQTKAADIRASAMLAMRAPVNNEGSTLATLWNAATFIVDRTASGDARKSKGNADRLGSMLFGSRGKRVEEIKSIVEQTIDIVMRNGEVQPMTVSDALDAGVDIRQLGKATLDAMLEDLG